MIKKGVFTVKLDSNNDVEESLWILFQVSRFVMIPYGLTLWEVGNGPVYLIESLEEAE